MKNRVVCKSLDKFYKNFRKAYEEFMKNEVEVFRTLYKSMESEQLVKFFKNKEIIGYSISIQDTGIDTGTEINLIYMNRQNKFFKCFRFSILDSFSSRLENYLLKTYRHKLMDGSELAEFVNFCGLTFITLVDLNTIMNDIGKIEQTVEDIVCEIHERYRERLSIDLMTDIWIPNVTVNVGSSDTSEFLIYANLLFVDKENFSI